VVAKVLEPNIAAPLKTHRHTTPTPRKWKRRSAKCGEFEIFEFFGSFGLFILKTAVFEELSKLIAINGLKLPLHWEL
jgi:hypothetical protein